MNGKFAGKYCEIIITSTPKTNTVWKVSAYFPKETSWLSIKSSYDSYKDQYQQKYGIPSKSYNFFSDPYFEGDGYVFMINNTKKDVSGDYKELITNESMKYLSASWEEIPFPPSAFKYYISKHDFGYVKTVYHFIFSVK